MNIRVGPAKTDSQFDGKGPDTVNVSMQRQRKHRHLVRAQGMYGARLATKETDRPYADLSGSGVTSGGGENRVHLNTTMGAAIRRPLPTTHRSPNRVPIPCTVGRTAVARQQERK